MGEKKRQSVVTRWLKKTNSFWFVLYAAGAAFCLYTCVYALRKAFSVASFEGLQFLGISYKVWLVTFQVTGYALSKFLGIRIISELKSNTRQRSTLILSGIAWISWLLFALVPAPYNIIFLFTNGLPLGLIWGIIFSYLEGRRFTEVLGAGLSVSFIFSSGLARTVGSYLMSNWSVSEFWMPFAAGTLFMIPLVVFAWLLSLLPPPSRKDEKLRTKRKPMDLSERMRFLRTFAPAILLFVLCYILLTTFRDFRDNFFSDLLRDMGQLQRPEIFTITEIPITLVILVSMSSIMLIKSNYKALMVIHGVIVAGLVLTGFSTWLYESGRISPVMWMILLGMGLYLSYVPFNSVFFDRMLATFHYTGTVGFIMYFADSFGYLGSVGVLFLKEFGHHSGSWLSFFISGSYFLSVAGVVLMAGSMLYFRLKRKRDKKQASIPTYSPSIALRSGI